MNKNGAGSAFDIIEYGSEVIQCEANALTALSKALDINFHDAVMSIFSATGKIVVSGMGKSGHIGKKIAASLASTGTPAFFIHPAEAAHGDLGMLSRGDVLVLISNSGESPELMHLAIYGKLLGVVVIAITSCTDSSLGRAATVVVPILSIPEACPLNIAPSTSTTMTLALGDAIALTVMKVRGFQQEDFATLHPGGKLGLRLSKLGTLMLNGGALPLVDRASNSHTTILEMTTKRLGMTGVTDDQGALCGVITDGDLRRSFDRHSDWYAEDIMSGSPITATVNMTAGDALNLMHLRSITALFVVDDNSSKPVGLIHIHQLVGLGIL